MPRGNGISKWPSSNPGSSGAKAKRPEALASGLSVELQLILTLDEALLEHLLIAEPQIGDVG